MTSRTLTLRSLDIPSVHKFGIGFDSAFNELLRMSEQQSNVNYPPYNIVKQTEDRFYIEVAIAGFEEGEIKISVENNTLTITGENLTPTDPNVVFLHRGISARSFDRSFRLGEHVEVLEAQTKNGILTVYLERRVPEALLPKTIDIKHL